ncbi:rRNA-binding ribosome biosynthesis protein rpf2 [Terramyces sp. JEL0728]|nr:rRNA-binding ribosome biosynthesis protein rpf2 [Terramyces sp. JEL0728]
MLKRSYTIINRRKPKTAAGHRAQKKKEPVAEEGAKTAVFLKGTTTSQVVSDALKDLYALKKPDAVMFSKRNDIHPFEDHKPFEFFSQKNDSSLFVFGTHSKKRPHNLTIVRLFDYQMMDMVELGIENYKGLKEFKDIKAALGNRPLVLFNGENWDANDELRTIKSMFLDLYTGDTSMNQLNLKGITHAMVFTVSGPVEKPKIIMKVYNILLKKSGVRLPRVELEEMGPVLEFSKRRVTLANADMMKESLRMPTLNKPKKEKNIEKNEFGEKTGRVWMEKQDLSKMQTRKMKGLKRKAEESVADEEGSNDE